MATTDNSSNLPIGNESGLILPEQVLPQHLFIMPLSSTVIFPSLMAPLSITEDRLVNMIDVAMNKNRYIGLLLMKGEKSDIENTTQSEIMSKDLYETGVVAKIIKRIKMPNGSINLLIHAIKRFKVKKYLTEEPYLVAETEYLDDAIEKDTELEALTRSVLLQVKKLSDVNPFFTDEMRMAMMNAPGAGAIADLVAFALNLSKESAQSFLETLDVKQRFQMLLLNLKREQDVAELQRRIHDDVNTKVTQLQREFFLKEQLKTIKKELGVEEDGKDKSARTFRERIEAAGMPADTKKVALEELTRFESLSEQSPEYNISRNYLENLCSLPWAAETQDQLDLEHAQSILDEEHFGLEKVKERILEFLAVRKLKDDPKGAILCLVGPPGVGKTSIGKSIASTLGRNFYRFSLGGMRDEAEIKGHRRTYIGAMPGKVIQGMKRAGSKNCVLMLDEIDKLGQSYQGDPASALLEVLDPEQNHSFMDHYIDVPFDLSKVLFIATANSLSTIPAPLLDRMEVIELPGYTLEEKEEIAVKYVIPKALKDNGLKGDPQVKFERSAIRKIMQDYAREPGLRILQQLMNRISRKVAAQVVRQHDKPQKVVISEKNLSDWLGPKRFYNEMAERITAPGVVVGLAWTSMGGDILFIESSDVPGGGALKLTGQMGEVMTESAAIAWSYVKKKASKELKISRDFLRKNDIHLHIPAGAIPKDGPSAGVTMATSLYSLLSGRMIRQKVAMTGELSLIGKVLPVGGIKEKLLAAKRSGIQEVILPELNRKDVAEISEQILKGLKIHFVRNIEEVFLLALEPKLEGKKLAKKITSVRRIISRPKSVPRTSRSLATV